MTPNQIEVTRKFIDEVLSDDKVWGQVKSSRGTVSGVLHQLLGFQVLPNGARRPLGEVITTRYGLGFSGDPYQDYPDMYEATEEDFDPDGIMETAVEETDTESKPEANTSVTATSDPVGDVLQQDVPAVDEDVSGTDRAVFSADGAITAESIGDDSGSKE